MPELMENILNNLNNEFYSLFSCALVNRHWCKTSIPILWRDPFSFNKLPMFITRYFSSLDDDEKSVLRDCGLMTKFPSKTLFHYAKFIKVLDLFRIVCKVQQWVDCVRADPRRRIAKEIVNLLLKLFIKSGATLSKLHASISDFIVKPEIFYLLGRNELFLSRLQVVSVEGVSSEISMDEAIMLLKILATSATKLRYLRLEAMNSIHAKSIHNAFANIIKSQQDLKRISLNYKSGYLIELRSIVSALESQCKSLQEIKIAKCACSPEFKMLMDCENLEVFRVFHAEDPKMLKILSNSLCQLTILEIHSRQFDASNVIQILERSGPLLKRLQIDSDFEILSQSLLLETLTSFCPNIIYLYISYIKFSPQFPRLIQNLPRLRFLTLKWLKVASEKATVTKKRVMRFAKLLPPTLQYLEWKTPRTNSHNDVLLHYCNAPLVRLLIHVNFGKKKFSETLIEFRTRKKTLKYVNVTGIELEDIEKDLEGYVRHVPYERIVIHC